MLTTVTLHNESTRKVLYLHSYHCQRPQRIFFIAGGVPAAEGNSKIGEGGIRLWNFEINTPGKAAWMGQILNGAQIDEHFSEFFRVN